MHLLLCMAAAAAAAGSRSLLEAVQENDLASLDILLGDKSTSQLEDRDQHGFTPLHWAVRMGSPEMTARLIEHGADLSAKGPIGYTPLHMAVVTRNNNIVPILLEPRSASIVISQHDHDGLTPLHVAAGVGNHEAAALLLEAGAAPDGRAATPTRQRPLHIACEQGHQAVAVALLAGGAALNPDSDEGPTPLCVALRDGHAPLAEMLLAQGGAFDNPRDPRCADVLLGLARDRGHREAGVGAASLKASAAAVVALGQRSDEARAWVMRLLQRAAATGAASLIASLIGAGAEQGTKPPLAAAARGEGWRGGDGWPPLCIASSMGYAEAVEALLSDPRVAPDGARCAFGSSPLLVSAQSGFADVAITLLRHGAAAAAEDEHGVSALSHAAKEGHAPVVRLLLAAESASANETTRRRHLTHAILSASAVGRAAAPQAAPKPRHSRWPSRRLRSVEKQIAELESVVGAKADPSHRDANPVTWDRSAALLGQLKAERAHICFEQR